MALYTLAALIHNIKIMTLKVLHVIFKMNPFMAHKQDDDDS